MALNPNLANQFSGPLVQSLMSAVVQEVSLVDAIANYFYQLSIDTALPDQLADIGLLIGFPWPTASAGAFDGTAFIFGTSVTYPIYDPLQGFGTVHDPTIGGTFSSVNPADTQLIPIAAYRNLLKGYAYLKYNGFTFATIDYVAHLFSSDYRIEFQDWFTFSNIGDPDNIYEGFADPSSSFGGEFIGSSGDFSDTWDIQLVFLTNIGPGNLFVVQSIFDKVTTDQEVVCSIDA